MNKTTTNQIKSRKRVAEHGEVFTAEREVKAMLDLVKPETERIDSRFLEPACGNGNFLVEILRRKLQAVEKQKHMWHRDKMAEKMADLSVLVVSSIYGIDIMQDNVEESRVRMLSTLSEWYEKVTTGLYPLRKDYGRMKPTPEMVQAWNFILDHNIMRGDFLTMAHPETKEPLKVRQWNIDGKRVEYTDYLLSDLVNDNEPRQLMLW